MKKLILALLLALPCVAKDYTPQECPIVGNTDSKIYHAAGGKFYARMLRENQSGDNRQCFKSEGEAQRAGYRKSKR
jgi:hypothetical protein